MAALLVKKRVEQIVTELKEHKLLDDEEILEHLKSSGITTSNDMLEIIDVMLQNESYFNFFIGNNFVNYAEPNDKFFDLVVKLSRLERFGYDVSNLGKIYESNPGTANFLYKKLHKLDEYRIALTIGYMIGRLGQIEPHKLFHIIDTNKNPTTNEKISYACALYSTAQNQKIPKRFVDLLISYSNSDDKSLKHHAISTLMIWFNGVKRIQKFLVSFAKESDENKNLVLQNVTPIIKRNEEYCMQLLKVCSNTDDKHLIEGGVGLNLGYVAPKYPIEVLTILKKWTKKKGFFLGQWPKWAAGEAGKGNIGKIQKFLLEWIRTERNEITCRFHLPGIIDEIYKEKDDELIRLLSKIDYKEKKKSQLIVKILEEALSEGFKKVTRSESFLNSCDKILNKIAKHQQLEINVDPTIKNPVIKTLALVNAVQYGKKKISPSEVKKNLRYFPNVVSFFGKNRLHRLIEQKPSHPLIAILSRVPVSEKRVKKVLSRIDEQKELWQKGMMLHAVKSRFYPASLLFDMDTSFAMFTENEQGRASIRDGMLDENSFYQTLIELNVSARFKKKYPTKLQPPIGGNNKLDVTVDIDGTTCLFEIYSPKEDLRLKYVRTVHSMKNKAKSGILTKLERQLKSAEGLGHPVILIIDKSDGASVDDIEITDSLFGTVQWTMLMDKKDGKIVKEYATRKRDSISELSPYSKVISGVILLKRDMDDNDLKVKLYGQTFLNPGAEIPLSKELVEKIESILLGQPIL